MILKDFLVVSQYLGLSISSDKGVGFNLSQVDFSYFGVAGFLFCLPFFFLFNDGKQQ